MDLDALRLGELVCARLCHDLGGLAGALAGALELTQGEGGDEALAVAREAADALSRRLQLLRTALGPVSGALGAAEIADLASGLGDRLRVDAAGLGRTLLPGSHARLALAMLLLGAEALPRGGVLRIASDTVGGMRAEAAGPGMTWPPGVTQGALSAPPTTPRGLMAPFCGLLARAAGMTLVVENTPPALRAMRGDVIPA
jgi:histidine phosphotransferase ChpT